MRSSCRCSTLGTRRPGEARRDRARRRSRARTADGLLTGDARAKREQAFTIVAEHAERRLAAYRGSAGRPAATRTPGSSAAPHPGLAWSRSSGARPHWRHSWPGISWCSRHAVPASADLDQVLAGYAALAAQLGGQLTALQGSPADALAKFAHRHQVTEIVLARNPGASRHRLLNELTHRAGDAEVHVLPAPAAR